MGEDPDNVFLEEKDLWVWNALRVCLRFSQRVFYLHDLAGISSMRGARISFSSKPFGYCVKIMVDWLVLFSFPEFFPRHMASSMITPLGFQITPSLLRVFPNILLQVTLLYKPLDLFLNLIENISVMILHFVVIAPSFEFIPHYICLTVWWMWNIMSVEHFTLDLLSTSIEVKCQWASHSA